MLERQMHLALLPFNDSPDAGRAAALRKKATYPLWPLPSDEAFIGNGGVPIITLAATGS